MVERKLMSAFQMALEVVEQLTLEEQEMLFEIAYHRFIAQRRMYLAKEVTEARAAYQRGDVRRGSVDDFLSGALHFPKCGAPFCV